MCLRAQIICDTSHLTANGYLDPSLASEVTAWYEPSEFNLMVVRAYTECVTKDLDRELDNEGTTTTTIFSVIVILILLAISAAYAYDYYLRREEHGHGYEAGPRSHH